LAATIGSSGLIATAPVVHIASVRAQWVVINSDLETADTANLLSPHNVTRSAFNWIPVPSGATRILYRAKAPAAGAVTTSPVVRLVGAFPSLPGRDAEVKIKDSGMSTTPGDLNHCEFLRLDNVDANAAGVTLSMSTTTNIIDATFEYSDPADLTGVDLKGATYVGMLVETAGNVAGGAVLGQVLFLN
jgi:uncharacterized protein YjbI with pentapeptide repeats